MTVKNEVVSISKVSAFADVAENLILIKFVGLKDDISKEIILLIPSHTGETILGDFYPTQLIWLQTETESGKKIKLTLPVQTRAGVKTVYEADVIQKISQLIQGKASKEDQPLNGG